MWNTWLPGVVLPLVPRPFRLATGASSNRMTPAPPVWVRITRCPSGMPRCVKLESRLPHRPCLVAAQVVVIGAQLLQKASFPEAAALRLPGASQ